MTLKLITTGHRAYNRDFTPHDPVPEGWTMEPAYIGYSASHRDYDAEIIDGQEVSNGLVAWGATREECLAAIADIEAEHPHFTNKDNNHG